MTRLERLLGIALLLSARRRLRADDLADHFGTSLRTVYRDVRALQASGFPVIGTAGDGYRLPPTSQLRPLALDPREAEALAIGARLLEGLADAPLKSRLKAAMAKLEAVLSPQAVGRVADLNDRVAVASPLLKTGPLATLLEATNERRVVDLTYHGIARGEITRRDIEPLGLVRYANVWLVPAYCRLRDDLRVFRADRVLDAKLTGTSFAPRSGLSLKDYLHRCEIEAARFPSGS